MIKPDRVVILGIEYDVLYFDELKDVDPEGERDLHGYICTINKEIRIHNGVDSVSNLQILIHEIIHGYYWALGEDVEGHNEGTIDKIATLISEFLVRNEWLRYE